MKPTMGCGSISIPFNQRRYEKDVSGHRTSFRCFRPLRVCSQFPRVKTVLIATPVAIGTWNGRVWALLCAPAVHVWRFWKCNLVWGYFGEEQSRCSLWRQLSGRNTQTGESRPIPTVANYTNFSLCLQGQYDTAFSEFAALARNRCQIEQKNNYPTDWTQNPALKQKDLTLLWSIDLVSHISPIKRASTLNGTLELNYEDKWTHSCTLWISVT